MYCVKPEGGWEGRIICKGEGDITGEYVIIWHILKARCVARCVARRSIFFRYLLHLGDSSVDADEDEAGEEEGERRFDFTRFVLHCEN